MIKTVTQGYDDLDENQKGSRKNFNSSDQWVNDHFKSQFGQNNKKGVARGFVLLDSSNTNIIGGYSLRPLDIRLDLEASEIKQIGLIKGLPYSQPLPAYLIVSLGVDQRFEKRGLGKLLLIEALMRIYEVSKHTGGVGVIVDASNANAEAFYQHFGFSQIPNQPKRYFLAMQHLKALFEP
ncbi:MULTISPECIES: GNAT family N-acetyltransferase [Acinetobacter calcoaceticus/baumannii complex]|uniref:GNAT family N-acetyltransferase n=1 Tax=Acinetobacter calcoaceticus/baumannii complex TaxID=909768 RepID=UPI00233E7920|nr:GNAT family N-acetyltransferase [Acinetobacter baumannii]